MLHNAEPKLLSHLQRVHGIDTDNDHPKAVLLRIIPTEDAQAHSSIEIPKRIKSTMRVNAMERASLVDLARKTHGISNLPIRFVESPHFHESAAGEVSLHDHGSGLEGADFFRLKVNTRFSRRIPVKESSTNSLEGSISRSGYCCPLIQFTY